jgi:hypothetical protein
MLACGCCVGRWWCILYDMAGYENAPTFDSIRNSDVYCSMYTDQTDQTDQTDNRRDFQADPFAQKEKRKIQPLTFDCGVCDL